jgi:DNA-binding beta-propeller fold protein YncE
MRLCQLLLAGALVFGLLGASASYVAPAYGALTFPFDGALTPAMGAFGFLESNSVSVDDLTEDTYVADSATGVIRSFGATGIEVSTLDGSSTPAGSFGAGSGEVAVAANDTTGELYVLDSTHGVVDVFDASGAYVCQITGSATPSSSECNGVAGSETPAGGFATPRGIAIDQATGAVFVLDAEHGVIDVFSVAGAFERTIELSAASGEIFAPLVRGVAASAFNGDIYVAEDLSDQVFVFDSTGAFVESLAGGNTPAGSFSGELSTAVDDATGRT